MNKLLWIGLAGAAGALSRYALWGVVQEASGKVYPYGTLAVNLVGCLIFGVIFHLSIERGFLDAELRTIVLVGFMGAFTTFSSLVYEAGAMMQEGEYFQAGGYLLLQNCLGLVCLFAGFAVARLF